MLKKYTVPNTIITELSVKDIMNVFVASQQKRKDFGSETICPFNGLWCAEKQNRLDEWRHAVQHVASKGENYLFFTRGDMFDGCPMDRKSLCAAYKQRQRG